MRIVILIRNITNSGGTEKATILLANSLVKRNYDVHILSIESLENSDSFFCISDKIKVRHLHAKSNFVFKIRSNIKNLSADVILGTSHSISFFLPFLKRRNLKVFAVEHIDFNSIPFKSKIILKLCYRLLDGIIVLSDAAKYKLRNFNKNIDVIPNQIEISTLYSNLEKKNIIMVGRLSKEKAYERVVPIGKELYEKYPDWTISIYGYGENEYKQKLKQLLLNNQLNNVIINDAVKDISQKYLESSIFLITSKNEAMPMVILEAKSYGLPTLGFSNEGVNRLIRNNIDGFIVNNENEAFLRLEELILDIKLREKLGKQGVLDVQNYSENKIVTLWNKILKG